MSTPTPISPPDDPWQQLRSHLDWAVEPWIAFAFCDDPELLERLRRRALEAVTAEGGQVRLLLPETPQALRERVRDLVAGPSAGLVWLEAPHGGPDDPVWSEAWDDLLMRLNERRERLRANLGGGLILAAPAAMKPRMREAAPDLWSIRSLVLEPIRAIELPPSGAARGNAHRIADAVLRIHLHLQVQRSGWIVQVVSDDPAPRRRLLEALCDSGLRIRVHGGPSQAVGLADDVALHWLRLDPPPPSGAIPPALLETLQRSLPVPLVIETTSAGSHDLLEALPSVAQRCPLIVRLYAERTAHPDPLPALPRARATLQRVWDAVAHARALQPEIQQTHSVELQHERIHALVQAVCALLAQGWCPEAAPLAEELLTAARAMPEGPEGDALRAEALELHGSVARHLGDLGSAARHYAAALPLRRALARLRGPQRRLRRSELARCLSVQGEIAMAAGDTATASGALSEALALRRRLARGSDDRQSLAELALSWSLLGDLQLDLHEVGDDHLDDAEAAYREALALRQQLAAQAPSVRYRRMLSMAWGRLGRALARRGDWASAHRLWSTSQELALSVAASDPGHVGWAMEASVAASRLGDASQALGDLGAAEAAYRQVVAQRRAMVTEDPENARWQELLAIALDRLADATGAQGRLGEAIDASQQAITLIEQLVWMDPVHLKWRGRLASAWIRRGDLAEAAGDLPGAQHARHRAASVASQILALGTPLATLQAKRLASELSGKAAQDPELLRILDQIQRCAAR